jgi:hypothetical protein
MVIEGDTVRVLNIDSSIIEKLEMEEQKDVRSMIGKIFKVEEIDEYGGAWVTQWWDREDGKKESHSLTLSPEEMEIVGSGSGR